MQIIVSYFIGELANNSMTLKINDCSIQCIVGNCLNKFENHFHKSGLLKQTMAMQSLLIIC